MIPQRVFLEERKVRFLLKQCILPGTMTHPLFYEELLDGFARAGFNVVGVHFQGQVRVSLYKAPPVSYNREAVEAFALVSVSRKRKETLNMEAIQLSSVTLLDRYACRSISVNPSPPCVGEATTLALAFKNMGPEAIILTRIQFLVAAFGMGLGWEQLPAIEHLCLPADPQHVEEVAVQWTPTRGGHRCVRVTVESDVLPQPLRIGRNLQIIEANADRSTWHVPFHLGNPENERMPVTLELGGDTTDGVDAIVLINGRPVHRGQPVWLNAGEVVDARLLLRAHTPQAIEAVKTVEASIQGRFIDGIQIEVYRPAFLSRSLRGGPEQGMRSKLEHIEEPASALTS